MLVMGTQTKSSDATPFHPVVHHEIQDTWPKSPPSMLRLTDMPKPPSGDLKVGIEMETINDKEARPAVYTNTKERSRVLRKLDWHILPLVSVLYLLSFLDRANIGNAKIAGMETDLNLVGLRYNTAAAIFFIPYCLAQVPSNIILKLFRPSRWIPLIMVVWGLTMTLMCLVKTYNGLLVGRFFLGLAEAGLLPGVVFYISTWYPRTEMAKRLAIFISAAIMGGAAGGFLAFAIEKMDGMGGLRGWQWIFCMEGIVTLLTAFMAFFVMHDQPETASFLTEVEKCYVIELLKTDAQGLATHYDSQFILQALKDYKIYLQFGTYLGFVIPGYAIALFTPTIINELGYSTAASQLLSSIPFVAGCTCTIIVGIYSDKYRLCGPFVIGGAFVALVGYTVLYTQTSPGAALVGVVLSAMGVFPCIPNILTWTSANAGGVFKRGVAVAMINGFGNLGGICSSFIFFDPPYFHVALTINIALLSFAILVASITIWNFNRLNREKERICRERDITDNQKDDFKEYGDDSPLFRYIL